MQLSHMPPIVLAHYLADLTLSLSQPLKPSRLDSDILVRHETA